MLFISTSMGLGGADRQVLEIAASLSDRGHNVLILSMTPIGVIGKEASDRGIKVESLGMKRGMPSAISLIKTIKIIKDFCPDIIHSHMFHANLLARISKLMLNRLVLVCTAHSINEGGRWRDTAYMLTDGIADATTHVSSIAAKSYVERRLVSAKKMLTVRNGVNIDRFSPNEKMRCTMRESLGLDDGFVWVSIARFSEAKDHNTLIKAFALVLDDFPRSTLLLVGDGPLKKDISELCRTQNLVGRVQFLGDRSDIVELLSASDAYVMSSAWEGLPMVLLEAGACMSTIVSTDVGGNKEAVSKANEKFLVPPKSPDALAKAMIKVMQLSAAELKLAGEENLKHVTENYALQKIVFQWENIYRNLLLQKMESI